MHIHAHAKSQIKHADLSANGGTSRRAKFSERAMLGLVESLETAVRKLTWDPPKSAWRDYYEARESYSSAAISAKETIVAGILAGHQSDLILDLGANTGRFSRIAAETGATVVAIEMDLAAVEMNYREHGDDSSSAVLPLWMDLANPSPAQGWAHAERSSLEERGPADVVLALALIHHLAIGNNVPFTSLLAWFARLGRRVIVEWIPKSDPMVLRLLATREDIFADYSEPAFVRAFEPYFECESVTDVPDSERRVYVLARRPTDGS
jgi:ribosomal protein L11 methylase PrmA